MTEGVLQDTVARGAGVGGGADAVGEGDLSGPLADAELDLELDDDALGADGAQGLYVAYDHSVVGGVEGVGEGDRVEVCAVDESQPALTAQVTLHLEGLAHRSATTSVYSSPAAMHFTPWGVKRSGDSKMRA